MSVIASNVHIVDNLEWPPFYDSSPMKSVPSSSSTYIPGLINSLVDCLTEILGNSNITVGSYATGTTTSNSNIGCSVIANCGNFKLLIGVCFNNGYYISVGITHDNPTYTTYTSADRAFGDFVYKMWTFSGSSSSGLFNKSSKCQFIKDSDNDNYYLLIEGSISSSPTVLGYAIGKFSTDNQTFLIPMYNTSTATSNYNPDSSSFSSNCVSIESTSTGTITHSNSIYPAYLFDRSETAGAVSGSSSTAIRYISGMCIWNLNASVEDKLESVPLLAVIPPSMIGRVSTYQAIPIGTMFNNYNNIVAIDNIVIPWTGRSDTPFITS